MISAEVEFRVEFYDVDPMQVVWHGNYFKFFEAARRALLDKINYGYVEMQNSGWAFPVTKTSAKYIRSFKLGDVVLAKAILTEYETCLKMKYELYNKKTGDLYTKGESSQMAVNIEKQISYFACPDDLIKKVNALL
ncbi:MAG: acyl-CoA thioesterase [Spirochaetaceae bacterium]|jgi:acyl-CoA thioester hydrolase|nr:acyl-CoA thioesterase [Spirochaetaceae bacterium]